MGRYRAEVYSLVIPRRAKPDVGIRLSFGRFVKRPYARAVTGRGIYAAGSFRPQFSILHYPFSTSPSRAGATASAKASTAASASRSVFPLLPTSMISIPGASCWL